MSNKKNELSKAEQFYIGENRRQKNVAELAADLALSPKVVQEYLDTLPELPPEPLKIGQFAVKDGMVAMTEAQSTAGDEVKPVNKQFLNAHSDCIHKIRPDEPIR